MSTQQTQKTETKVPQQQQGKEYQSSQQKGKMEASDIEQQQSASVKSQQESSMGEKSKVQGQQSGQQLPQQQSQSKQSTKQEKTERLYDIDVAKRDLEVRDYTCTLKMNESCTVEKNSNVYEK